LHQGAQAGYESLMRALITLLCVFAFAASTAAACPHDGAGAGPDMSELPPCHQQMMADMVDMVDDADCPGGAFCVDCAVSIGLTPAAPDLAVSALATVVSHDAITHAAPRGPSGSDPPPPKA
jgi:hypothetical protein